MRKQGSKIPNRQIHWKKYSYLRAEEEQVYYRCQCGKKYISFPAIYLHFQRKHNQKIKNLHDPSQFKTVNEGSQTIHIFFLKQTQHRTESHPQSQTSKQKQQILNQICSLFDFFQTQCRQKILSFIEEKYVIKIMDQFLQFVNKKDIRGSRNKNLTSQSIISKLPYKFNQFMLQNKELYKHEFEYAQACSLFLYLAEWLNFRNYSELIVKLDHMELISEDTNQ